MDQQFLCVFQTLPQNIFGERDTCFSMKQPTQIAAVELQLFRQKIDRGFRAGEIFVDHTQRHGGIVQTLRRLLFRW